jgi:hypothetical protein
MTDHLKICIEETKQAILRHEEALQLSPSRAVELSLQSFRKRLQRLEADLKSLAGAPLPIPGIETSPLVPESNCIPPKGS